ncbi:amino acid deaminase [Falsochrobactrum shanghaiense]|uniref:Amino acid deaminase n=1 Tax=Falsochrobactrum shanghaiense TaxID=2201899 RepID=A0A316JB98_9HYPH|nr:alanine racemase [Falsochrobactrum shanghaiense]PWL18521.1 amino acid deaminase [Falsochrobactrum shanghaiense]
MAKNLINGEIRGFPSDHAAVCVADIASVGIDPRDGSAQLPLLTFDRSAWEQNCTAMFSYLHAVGARIAPHAKTPMSPELARDLLERGAVALTVADIRQAAVMLGHGFDRLILANQIGGRASGARLGRLLAQHPAAQVILYVDSLAALATAAEVAATAGRRIDFLIEVGGGRAGARDRATVLAILEKLADYPDLRAVGIAAYEGASASGDLVMTRKAIAELHAFAAEAFAQLRALQPEDRLMLSSGGSSFFDLVIEDLGPTVSADGNADLVLRSGAIFFYDHGVYARGLANLDQRGGFAPAGIGPAREAFRPALLAYAEVLSRPEPGLAICGMGMRDVSFDQGLPVPVSRYRDGNALPVPEGAEVVKLNDQHAFLRLSADADVEVGDIFGFGISHPCTALDRWSWLFVTGPGGKVVDALPMHFG